MTSLHETRADFIKRLFAVSVSVGFATQLARAPWLENATVPTEPDIRNLVLLFVAVSAVIGSWEGYFASIAHKPLVRLRRFLLDIVIVFEYLVLMLASAHDELFLWVLASIFATYLVWDYVSVLEFRERYEIEDAHMPWLSAFAVFIRGLSDSRPDRAKGPSITLFWFICLALIIYLGTRVELWSFIANAVSVWSLLIFYRIDKHLKLRILTKLLCGLLVVALPAISGLAS